MGHEFAINPNKEYFMDHENRWGSSAYEEIKTLCQVHGS